jgi:hypothetical protein
MRKKSKFRKKFIPVLLALTLFLLPFSSVAFAAIDSGYNSPHVNGYGGLNQGTTSNSVDSNLTTNVDIGGNGFIKYDGFTNTDTLNVWVSAAGSGNSAGKITFYDSSGATISTTSNITVVGTTYVKKTFSVPVGTNSFKIESVASALYGSNGWAFRIHEVELNNVITHNEITNLAVTSSGNSATINYSVPSSNPNFTGSKIYRDGRVIATLGTAGTSYTDTGLLFDTKYTYTVTATYNDNYETVGVSSQITTGSMPHDEATNLGATVGFNSANLSWSIPNNQYLVGFKIYRNNTLIKTLNTIENTYVDNGLNEGTSYNYKVTSLYSDGYETSGVSYLATTNTKPHDEVTNVTTTVSYNSSNLSWTIINNPYLVGFKIYRDNTLIKTLSSSDIYYDDTGLNESTEYHYKITALYDDGFETAGVSIISTTTTEPHDEISNLSATSSFNSASLTWTIPSNQFLMGFNIYRDNTLIKTLDANTNTYEDDGLKEGTDYNYKIVSVYNDSFVTTGVSRTVTTLTKPHDEITNLNPTPAFNSVSLTWSIPNNPYLVGFNLYKDNTLIKTLGPNVNTYQDDGLSQGTSYNYKITSLYDDNFETVGITSAVTTNTKPHDEITNLNADMTYNSAKLSWVIPDNQFLVGFNIFRDDQLIKSLDKSANSYEDTGLTEVTSYNYKIVSIYDDNFVTTGVSNTFTTPEDPVVKQVTKAVAVAVSYKQVNLSWNLPNQHSFHHINIYRAVEPKKQNFFQAILGTIASADTQPKEIFETNGTYFNDLTVEPDTSYQYSLTSETTDGRVSDPITVSADTPKEPTPVLQTSGNYTVDSNGDYVFKWSQPSTGTVKVAVGGKDYATADASQQQITIPKKDIQTSVWGDPNVSLIPVGEFGTTGKEVAVGGNKFQDSLSSVPFKPSDLLTTSLSLMTVLGPILLLALTFIFYKPLVRTLKNTIKKNKKGSK